jgi:SAM-dependent methyltransferase
MRSVSAARRVVLLESPLRTSRAVRVLEIGASRRKRLSRLASPRWWLTTAVDAMEANRAWWDERARLHGQDGVYYDVDGFLAGASAISARELGEIELAIGSVRSKALLHVQCHIGLTTLSLARLGADVVGLDFSDVAVSRARDIALAAGVDADFVVADARRLPEGLQERFDCVFASYGVLMWINDLRRWMESVASALDGGGHLVLLEGHPVSLLVKSVDPLVLEGPYQGGTTVEGEGGDYAHPEASTEYNAFVHYRWGIGDVVNAAIRAGLRIEAVTEWTDEEGRPAPGGKLVEDDDGRARMYAAGAALPLTYSLRASKPDVGS